MRECLYYWLVEPIRQSFCDKATFKAAVDIPIETTTGKVHFAIFLEENGLPAYGRLQFACGDDDRIPEARLPLLQSVKEHFLSVLRLEFSEDAYLFPRPIWTFIESGSEYSVGLKMQVVESAAVFDPLVFQKTFEASFEHREEVRLLLDGADKRIPLQYRYLSLYRLLELILRPDGQWKKDDLESALRPYGDRLKEEGFSRSPVNTLHELRDSCAHIRTGQAFGVTHLNQQQATRVEKFLPILLDVCVSLVNSRFGPSLTFGRGPKPIDAIK